MNKPNKQTWETPVLICAVVKEDTRGGTWTISQPGDDAWYQS